MTIKDWAQKYYVSHGMFENQAKDCLEKAISSKLMESISDKWIKDIDGYPPVIKILLVMNLNTIALEYIDENIPEAWFRDLFDHKAE